jgi:ribosome maturation factor RimP
MRREKIREKVRELALEAVEVAGVELFDTEILGQRGQLIVRVTIDSLNGIGINDCELVSRQLEALLDIEDPIPGSYTLEVTSPGLDRPLREISDYERFKGRLARVVTKERLDNQTFFIGRIRGVKEDRILLESEPGRKERERGKGRIVEIPFDKITKARLEIEI